MMLRGMMVGKLVFSVLITTLAALLIACSVIAPAGPQSKAREAFEQWAEEAGTPYEDVRYETLSDDGTFATVRVTAFFAESPESGWREMQADVECRKVAGEWGCDQYFSFGLSEAERQRILDAQNATTTAVMATQVAAQATTTAEYEETIRATQTAQAAAATAQAAVGATAESAGATQVAAAIDEQLSALYAQGLEAYESGDWWMAGYRFSEVADMRADYGDVQARLEGLEPQIGHIAYVAVSDGMIYLMTGLGRDHQTIGSGREPVLSSDGSKIAYLVDSALESDTIVRLGDLPGPHEPVLRPSDISKEIREYALIGQTIGVGDLTLSPGADRIATTHGQEGIFVYDIHEGRLDHIYDGTALRIDWSRDGQTLCFVSFGGLFTVKPDGTALTEIYTHGEVWQSACAWSPDGQWIAIEQEGRVCVLRADGSDFRAVTWGTHPDWSPDGSKLVYHEPYGGIWIVSVDASNPVQILTYEDDGELPSWAP